MTDGRAERTIAAAEGVSALLTEMDIEHAVIGAMAMAAHGYERATLDFDIGTAKSTETACEPLRRITNCWMTWTRFWNRLNPNSGQDV